MTTVKFTVPIHAFVDVVLEMPDCTEDQACEVAEIAANDGELFGVSCHRGSVRILDYLDNGSTPIDAWIDGEAVKIHGSIRLQDSADVHEPPGWDVSDALEDDDE
jgi:hypothetical protein